MTTIRLTTLPNGLRIITDTVAGMDSIALGVWVGVGTRHEDLSVNGVAHMVEHMLFKGTKTRNARQIAEEIENVGGSVNAYTSRDITSYHLHLLKDDTDLGLNILTDMLLNSTLPEEEIEREREVILQEIGMSNDTPDDLIFDHYFETAYPRQSIGAPILGRAHNIEAMNREMLQQYMQQFYTPARMVISAAGAVNHDDFVAKCARLFAQMPADTAGENPLAAYKNGEIRVQKDLEQAHVILGFEGINRLDPDYTAVQILSTVLGGGMSSRLFQEIREKRGLVYSIFAFHSGYQDAGQFGIYAGTGPEKLTEIMPVICDEVLKLSSSLNAAEINRAKAQIKAGTLMGRESMMTRADSQAKTLLFRNKIYDLPARIALIDAVDMDALARLSKRIFSGPPSLAALGPIKNLEDFEHIQKRLAA